MNLEDFRRSIENEIPPQGLDPLLLALWYDAKGDWERSHNIIQDIETKDAALIHAYLHRKEGDIWNAVYWYRRAGKNRPDMSLDAELDQLILKYLL